MTDNPTHIDRRQIIERVRQSGSELNNLNETYQGDREIVLAAVEDWGQYLMFASKELRGDYEVVLAAVRRCGRALRYASKELRGNRDVCGVAISHDAFALKYVIQDLRCDREIIDQALNSRANKRFVRVFMSDVFWTDAGIVLAILEAERGREASVPGNDRVRSLWGRMNSRKKRFRKIYETLRVCQNPTQELRRLSPSLVALQLMTRLRAEEKIVSATSNNTMSESLEKGILDYCGHSMRSECLLELVEWKSVIELLAASYDCSWWDFLSSC